MVTKRSDVALTPKVIYNQNKLIEVIEKIISSIKEDQEIYEAIEVRVDNYNEPTILEVEKMYKDAGWEITRFHDDGLYLRLK